MYSQPYFLNLLQLDIKKYPAIAVVGGGGKTSLIYRLTEELVEAGKKVIVTTTTHMAWDASLPFARDGNREDVQEKLAAYGYVLTAALDEPSGKFTALPEEKLAALRPLGDVMLIEADGSRQLPIKVPETWEPAIPKFADLIISVIGLDCLGRPIRETAHRAAHTAEFLGKEPDALMTPEDIVKIAASPCALRKNVGSRVYRVFLNKTDTLLDEREAKKIAEEFGRRGITAACASLLRSVLPREAALTASCQASGADQAMSAWETAAARNPDIMAQAGRYRFAWKGGVQR